MYNHNEEESNYKEVNYYKEAKFKKKAGKSKRRRANANTKEL